jgi:hypothetical protein
MKYFVAYMLFLFSFTIASTQIDMKWGEIPWEDLAMTHYPLDSSANAAVLHESGWLHVTSNWSKSHYNFNKYRRIKILHPSGFEEGDISLYYYSHDGTQMINDLKARITLPNGQFYELSKKDFIRNKVSDRVSSISWAFPHMEVGAVIEYAYQLYSESIMEPQTWYFQSHLPTRRSLLKFTNESYFSYVTLFETGGDMQREDGNDGTVIFSEGDTRIIAKQGFYTMENAPALKEEDYITCMNDYRARIRYQLSEANYPTGEHREYLSSWENAGRMLNEDESFGQYFRKKRHANKLLSAISPQLLLCSSDLEKAQLIYSFIGQQIAWDGEYRAFPSKKPNDIFEQKKGHSADVSIAMLALLKGAGIEAHPVFISTRTHGKMIQKYPIMDQFDHLMVLVVIDGEAILLDTPSAYHPFGYLRDNSLNKTAWLLRENNSSNWLQINPPLSEEILFYDLNLLANGQLDGRLQYMAKSHAAIDERLIAKGNQAKQEWEQRLGSDCTIKELTYTNADQLLQPLKMLSQFSIPEAGSVINDFIYIAPTLYSAFSENVLQLEERHYPVEFLHPLHERIVMNIQLPDGYEVAESPEGLTLNLSDGSASFNYQAMVSENKLTITHSLKIKKTTYEPSVYKELKDFLDQVAEKLSEQVVLNRSEE